MTKRRRYLDDWDPSNPYHYHNDRGEKIVITPEDWNRYKDDPMFRNIRDAILQEQAAHPGPEYEINQDFVNNLRGIYRNNTTRYQNYRNYQNELPEGYSFTEEGMIRDNNGNYYVQSGFRQTPRFTYDESNPLTFTIRKGQPHEGNLTFYPVNMERREIQPLPVDRRLDITQERNNAINSYIRNNSERRYRTPYIISGEDRFDPNRDKHRSIEYIDSNNIHTGDWRKVSVGFDDIINLLPYISKQQSINNLKTIQTNRRNHNTPYGLEYPRETVIDNVGRMFIPSQSDAALNAIINPNDTRLGVYSNRSIRKYGGPKGRQWRKLAYGTNDATRQRVYDNFPRLVAVTDSIANEYNINPSLLRTRLANEGIVDMIAQDVDYRINYGDTLRTKHDYIEDFLNSTSYGGIESYGLDDVGTLINEGKINPIRENYDTASFTNENGRRTLGVNGFTNYDNIGLTAATLQYFRNVAKQEYPNASSSELDRYANILYNRGIAGGKRYIKNGGRGYNLQYMAGGIVRPGLKNGGIYIKPSHRGRFTALKEKTGHSTTWFKENGTPAQKKMATFALNAAKWKH